MCAGSSASSISSTPCAWSMASSSRPSAMLRCIRSRRSSMAARAARWRVCTSQRSKSSPAASSKPSSSGPRQARAAAARSAVNWSRPCSACSSACRSTDTGAPAAKPTCCASMSSRPGSQRRRRVRATRRLARPAASSRSPQSRLASRPRATPRPSAAKWNTSAWCLAAISRVSAWPSSSSRGGPSSRTRKPCNCCPPARCNAPLTPHQRAGSAASTPGADSRARRGHIHSAQGA